jgi:anti-sigma regulatory factor (Ser/Thr protein kinase)
MTPIARSERRVLASFAVESVPGNERIALARVTRSAAALGLSAAQLERLGTAVAEATMNAIEHGNGGQAELPVEVEVVQAGHDIVVAISDQGGEHDAGCPEDAAEVPDLGRKLGGEQTPRGWGLFLIRHMVDAMEVTTEGARHTVRLTMRGRPPEESEKEGTDGQSNGQHGRPPG